MSKETARIKRVLSEMGSLIKYKNQWCVGEFNLNYQRYRETLNLLLKNVSEGAEILDVGCSPGYLTFAMHKLGFKVQGVDLNPNQCIKEIRESGIAIKRCNLDNEPLPFEKECFDAVVFTEVIEHLNPWRINSVLQEIKRVLKPYGMLILSTPNLAALENRLFLLIGGIRYLGGGIIPPAHAREYTLQELLDFLQSAGFKLKLKHYSMARDAVTYISKRTQIHVISDENQFVCQEHVITGFLKHPNWINIGRAISLPLKILVPSLRSTIFVLAQK